MRRVRCRTILYSLVIVTASLSLFLTSLNIEPKQLGDASPVTWEQHTTQIPEVQSYLKLSQPVFPKNNVTESAVIQFKTTSLVLIASDYRRNAEDYTNATELAHNRDNITQEKGSHKLPIVNDTDNAITNDSKVLASLVDLALRTSQFVQKTRLNTSYQRGSLTIKPTFKDSILSIDPDENDLDARTLAQNTSRTITSETNYETPLKSDMGRDGLKNELKQAPEDNALLLNWNLEWDNTAASPEDDLHRDQARAFRKHIYKKYYHKIRNQAGLNCSKIIEGDPRAIQHAERIMQLRTRVEISTETYARIYNCNSFKRKRGFIEDPLSDAERDFPIAFSLIVYKDIEQVERLLRAIYRPHNHYCIHVDSKAKPLERKGLEQIAGCFDNVFIASRSINVSWGEFSVLETELICMEELIRKPSWKYYINLTGQEFPLKTNRELVKILEAMNDDNVVEIEKVRAKQRYFYRWSKSQHPPPHNIRPIKGAVHVAISRAFVEFCLHDNRAQDFLEWLEETEIPDETFFASMNYNAHLNAPGGDSSDNVPVRMATFMRYKNWRPATVDAPAAVVCSGKYVRNICVLGVDDLHRAYSSRGLFINKFHLDYQHVALDCLEELLHEKTWREYLEDYEMYVHLYETPGRLKYEIIR